MPRIDPDIVQHRIPTLPEVKPVKQKLRRMKLEWMLKIKKEVIKQLKAGFIKAVNQTGWVANVVPVPKKDGKVRNVWILEIQQGMLEGRFSFATH
jgi:hypothetical protein